MNSLLIKREQSGTPSGSVFEAKSHLGPDSSSSGAENLGCQCTKSRCLKLYCACFARGKYCGKYCKCKNCCNYKGSKLLRRKIQEKNKNTFSYKHEAIYEENIDLGSNGSEETPLCCKCSRSGCIKAYCECFARGRYCTDFCKCINCKNRPEYHSTKKVDYMRWKNLMKSNEKNIRKKITNKLEYVFMPAGSLYSLMISKINHQNENSQDEDCTGLLQKINQSVNENLKMTDYSNVIKSRLLNPPTSTPLSKKLLFSNEQDLMGHYTKSISNSEIGLELSSSNLAKITNQKKTQPHRILEDSDDLTQVFSSELISSIKLLGSPQNKQQEDPLQMKKEEVQRDEEDNSGALNNHESGILNTSFKINENFKLRKLASVNKTPPISPPFTPVSTTPKKSVGKNVLFGQMGLGRGQDTPLNQHQQQLYHQNLDGGSLSAQKSQFGNIFLKTEDNDEGVIEDNKDKEDGALGSDPARWQGSLIFETPKKPKGSNSKLRNPSMACMRTALTTSTSTPNQPRRRDGASLMPNKISQMLSPDVGNKSAVSKLPSSRSSRRAMIMDEWAMYTETQVKTNIILNEFFKMIRPKEAGPGVRSKSSDSQQSGSPKKVLKIEEG